MKLIVGLGNPGKQYTNTRHNIGFAALDWFWESWFAPIGFSAWTDNKKFRALMSQGLINEEKIILLKPQTFMNESGAAVSAIANFYKISPADILVMHDELDLPFGEFKIQRGKSSAGHNGVGSIIERLGSQDFTRLRLGISPADGRRGGADFVLGKFNLWERLKLKKLFATALEECKKIF